MVSTKISRAQIFWFCLRYFLFTILIGRKYLTLLHFFCEPWKNSCTTKIMIRLSRKHMIPIRMIFHVSFFRIHKTSPVIFLLCRVDCWSCWSCWLFSSLITSIRSVVWYNCSTAVWRLSIIVIIIIVIITLCSSTSRFGKIVLHRGLSMPQVTSCGLTSG